MPELPEVETVARQLDPLIRGRRASRLDVFDRKLLAAGHRALEGSVVSSAQRVGKQVVVAFRSATGSESYLAVHLRMTGRLVWRDDGDGAAVPHRRARLMLEGGRVDFIDPRRFGTLTWHDDRDEVVPVGIDPLDPRLSVPELHRLLRNARQPLKTWLLRQDRLVGIGNIYASEILHEAGLDPFRAGGELEPVETRRLHRALKAVLRRAIRYCGTTFSDFQDAHGVTGSYQTRLRVYGREGEPCKRCGAPIVRVSQAQRSTYYCSARCSPDAPPQARKRRPEKKEGRGASPA